MIFISIKYKNKPNLMKVNLYEMLKHEKDIFSRDFALNRFVIPIEKPFFIDNEDLSKYEPTKIKTIKSLLNGY